MENVPIPINEASDDPLAKINVLLQAYISRLSLDGFALVSDMIYVVQSAGRLFRAMQEFSICKGWSYLAKVLINLGKMVDKKLWLTNTPLRQFPQVPREVLQTAERSLIPWKHYLNLKDEYEVGQAFKTEKYGKLVFDWLQKFPKISLEGSILPITPSLLKVEIEVTPNWKWDVELHGYSESFTVLVEDCDSEKLLYHGSCDIKKQYINELHVHEFTIPLIDSSQPNFFVSLISDRWLHCGARIPLMLTSLRIPDKFSAPTPMLDLHLIPKSELGYEEFEKVFSYTEFNKVQSQVFDSVYNDTKNVLVCTSKGNGKTDIAILALLNHWKQEKGRAIYLNPCSEEIDLIFKSWRKKVSKVAGGKVVNKLTGELSADLKLLGSSHLILATPEQFDLISRLWMRRKNVQSAELIIADDVHTIGSGSNGVVYETVLSRMRFMQMNMNKDLRFVGLSASLASARDLGEWLGVSKRQVFNFDSKERVYPVSAQFMSFDINHNPSLLKSMIKPVYTKIQEMDPEKGEDKAIVFVPSRKQCIDISVEFIKYLNRDETSWLNAEDELLKPYLKKITDPSLKSCLVHGIA
ncbi:unnamed protein product [Ambrosiozyma monospora]|uniref:Unnamed protein product n=1 Tax=Ambrosiozyma monospora TaxID=43982 RepID=A0A9W7DIU6_AMBMO|nr:unnamed protein product [Ambrosiozyma monospora]